jgi:rhodanese-related sulfurtransferase
MKLALQVAMVIGAGSLTGLGVNAASPHPADLLHPVFSAAESGGGTCSAPHGDAVAPRSPFRSISPTEAAAMCTGCTAAFVDARAASEFAEGHIHNALHLPPHDHPGEADALAQLRSYPTVVVYDSGMACNLADTVAAHLREEGLPDVRILEGAWPDWVKAGGPAESGACQACSGGGPR